MQQTTNHSKESQTKLNLKILTQSQKHQVFAHHQSYSQSNMSPMMRMAKTTKHKSYEQSKFSNSKQNYLKDFKNNLKSIVINIENETMSERKHKSFTKHQYLDISQAEDY